MSTPLERILVVESDPEVGDLIARQVLRPLGYGAKVVTSAPTAIQAAPRFSPDIIIVNLNLPELSGKDLLVALSFQGEEIPIIVIAEQGFEEDVIQAFRLGATDFLKSPLREAEIVSAVERVLRQVRAKRERRVLARKLEQTNRELKRRVRDLTTIFGIGKAVTSITDHQVLFDRIVEGAVSVTEADKGWLHLRKGDDRGFILRASKNLPGQIAAKHGQEWDDGISSLVALSGETFSIHGKALKRFKVSQLGKSALVVPVKAQEEVVGLLVTVRENAAPFDPSNQALLEAVADYVSVSLVNARLFHALEEQARAAQDSVSSSYEDDWLRNNLLRYASQFSRLPFAEIEEQIDVIMEAEGQRDGEEHKKALRGLQANLGDLKRFVDAMLHYEQGEWPNRW